MSFGATTYSHWAGTGKRDWLIDITTTCDITNGPISNIVDGVKASNNGDGVYCNTNQSGREWKFKFPWPIRIDEFTWTQDSTGTQGTWKIAGSNDDITYTDLGTGIDLGGAAAADVHAFTNPDGYVYYKLIQTAGTTTNTRWIQEIEFKVSLDSDHGGNATGTTSYSNLDGTGDRSSRMLMQLNVATACGGQDVGDMKAMLNGVTGVQNCTDATAFTSGSSREIKIGFRDPLAVNAFTWKQQVVSGHGTWKIAGSNDDITYTDLGTGFALGAGSTSEEFTFTNSTGYNLYKLIQTAGTTSTTPWLYEIEFKTSAVAQVGHYFAAGAAFEVLAEGDGSNALAASAALEVLGLGDGSNALVALAAIEVLAPVPPPVAHYFAAGAAVEILNTGVGSNAIASAAALEILNTGDGSTAFAAQAAIEVLSTRALMPTRAFDGTEIFEFAFAFQPENIYADTDYDSIYSIGDRTGNGTLEWNFEGFTGGTFGTTPGELSDFNWGSSGGNGFGVGGQDGWPGGAFVSFSTVDRSFQYVSGFKVYQPFGSWPGEWIMFAGYDGEVWAVNHAEFDEFIIGSFPEGVAGLEFTPPMFPFNYWSFTLASIPDSSSTDFPGVSFASEILFKVYHSVLDGGDRRPTNLRAIKRLTVTHSSGIETNSDSGSGFDALLNLIDGRYSASNGGPNPPTGKSTPSRFRRVGWTPGDEAVNNPGEWIQFSFPRKVFMREMVWNVGNPEQLDGAGNPVHFGTWQWQASNAPTTGFVDIGNPWHFLPGSSWMKAPKPLNEAALPPLVNARYEGDYHDYMYPYWRMVLVEGPAFAGTLEGNIFQIQFNLIDPNNQDPIYEAAFSDDTDNNLPIITVGPAGSPYDVKLSDGDSDVLTATISVVNNPILSAAFSDGTGDGFVTAVSSFTRSRVSQTMVVIKGR